MYENTDLEQYSVQSGSSHHEIDDPVDYRIKASHIYIPDRVSTVECMLTQADIHLSKGDYDA